jgi:SPP1 gp7 family putative phage head morphogenesis protein
MTLVALYTSEITGAVAGAAAVDELAAQWQWQATQPAPASTPGQSQQPAPQEVAAAAAALAGIGTAASIATALAAVLAALWAEGWALGHGSANSVLTGQPPDWEGWAPGDPGAARAAGGDGADALIQDHPGIPHDIAATYVDRLAQVLADGRKNGWDRDELVEALRDVVNNPASASRTAHTELCRAQFQAAVGAYRDAGVTHVDVVTMGDDRVCPVCQALADGNPWEIPEHADFTMLPAHPMDRCVVVPAPGQPVTASAAWGRLAASGRHHAALNRAGAR